MGAIFILLLEAGNFSVRSEHTVVSSVQVDELLVAGRNLSKLVCFLLKAHGVANVEVAGVFGEGG